MSSLTHAGLWADDAQIDDLRITRGEVMKGGQVTVHVSTL